jgi:hypothetical protein
MKALVGYGALQRPLGRALAEASDAALEGYVNSIRLYPKQVKPDAGRQSPNVYEPSPPMRLPERRAAMWGFARARWLEWDFNKADPNQHLIAITWSDLDYAIVAYAVEYMDEAALNQEMQSIREQITTLEAHWHRSFTDILTVWTRLLSRFQPYAHARVVGQNGGDWLPETRTYMPFERSKNEYTMMMFRAM